MNVGFVVNLYDNDGSVWRECVLLTINDTHFLQFRDVEELELFVKKVKACIHEIKTGEPLGIDEVTA